MNAALRLQKAILNSSDAAIYAGSTITGAINYGLNGVGAIGLADLFGNCLRGSCRVELGFDILGAGVCGLIFGAAVGIYAAKEFFIKQKKINAFGGIRR